MSITGRLKQVVKVTGILTILGVLAATGVAAYVWWSEKQDRGEDEWEDEPGFETGDDVEVEIPDE